MNPILNQAPAGRLFPKTLKALFAATFLVAGIQSTHAQSLQSPKGAEVFQAIVLPPPQKTVRIAWSYPVNFETPDLVFKVYHATNLNVPFRQWELLTNIPGALRSATLVAEQSQEFFVMTASNYLGESDFSTQ